MTIEELLETPLLRGAKVIAGSRGLMHEVTWCAADIDPLSTNELMPGMLLLVTVHENEDRLLERYVDHLGKIMVAGIAFFEADEPNFFTPEEIAHAMDRYEELSIPVIKLPRGTNQQTFRNRFVQTYSRYYAEQNRRSDWLQEICQGSGRTGGETLARAHGYNPDTGYCCIGLSPVDVDKYGPATYELEIEAVKNFTKKELSRKDARLLYFLGRNFIIAFFPWEEGLPSRLRDRIYRFADKLRESHPTMRWDIIVGSYAHRLSDFRASYERTVRTYEVLQRLGVREKASFYDDWYLHQLLLNEPPEDLRRHMTYVLAPILDFPELLETLSAYLVFGENVRETARKTGVPESTFKYRLRRVGQLLEMDLGDPQARFQLRMALTIEKYLRDEQ